MSNRIDLGVHVLHSVDKRSSRQETGVVLGENGVAATLGAEETGARGSNLPDTVLTVVVSTRQETRVGVVL